MLEEKNDNLQHADGNTTDSVESTPTATPNEEVAPISETIATTTETDDNQTIIEAIADSNAEESEDENLKERHDIPMQDYDTLSMESLVEELNILVSNEKVSSIKDHVEEIKKAFLAKYNHLIEEKKEEFIAENQDPNEDFQYHFPLKSKFDTIYSVYRNHKNEHFKSLQTSLKNNLENRLAIVEELKELINPQANIKDILKHFNELRERWKMQDQFQKTNTTTFGIITIFMLKIFMIICT
jgi:hypothetical protein